MNDFVKLSIGAENVCGSALAAMVGYGAVALSGVGWFAIAYVVCKLIREAWDHAVNQRAEQLRALRDQEGPHAG